MFIKTEEFLTKDLFVAKSKLAMFYHDILSSMNKLGVQLVGNDDFLDFIIGGSRSDLSDDVKQNLLPSNGATPITNEERLKTVLTSIWRERVRLGLDFEAVFSLP